MLVEFFLSPILFLINKLIEFMPQGYELPSWIGSTISLLRKGMYFFPLDVWLILIANITFWLTVQMVWAVIEWLYKKIPGVD